MSAVARVGPPHARRLWALYRARRDAWRRSGGDPAAFRVLMQAWLDAGRPPC